MKRFFKWLGITVLLVAGAILSLGLYDVMNPFEAGSFSVGKKSVKIYGKYDALTHKSEGRNIRMVFDGVVISFENEALTVNGKPIAITTFDDLAIYLKRGGDPQVKVVKPAS